MHRPAIRHWFAVGFLIITSLISGMYSFFIHPPKILVTNDGAAQWEGRIYAVRERLPDSVEILGISQVAVWQGTDYEWIV